MVKARSPQYPVIGLSEAIDKIGMVYKMDVQNKIPKAVVAKHAGYNSLNGKSLGVLSALTKYGLLEGRGDETYVSDLALQIIAHPEGSPERTAAIQEAATRPRLFSEINEKFKDGRVSTEALRAYLLTQKFLPSAVETVIPSYYDTLLLVRGEIGEYNSSEEEDGGKGGKGDSDQKPPPPPARKGHKLMEGERVLSDGILSKTATYRVIVEGSIGVKEIERLIAKLEMDKEILADDTDEGEEED